MKATKPTKPTKQTGLITVVLGCGALLVLALLYSTSSGNTKAQRVKTPFFHKEKHKLKGIPNVPTLTHSDPLPRSDWFHGWEEASIASNSIVGCGLWVGTCGLWFASWWFVCVVVVCVAVIFVVVVCVVHGLCGGGLCVCDLLDVVCVDVVCLCGRCLRSLFVWMWFVCGCGLCCHCFFECQDDGAVCEPPRDIPEYCCVGATSNGGRPAWKSGRCNNDSNQFYNYTPQATHHGIRDLVLLMAKRNHSMLTLIGDSTGLQYSYGALCDALRDGCTMVELPPSTTKYTPADDWHYGVKDVDMWVMKCDAAVVTIRSIFVYRPRLNNTILAHLLDEQSNGIVELSFGAHYLFNDTRTKIYTTSKQALIPGDHGDVSETFETDWKEATAKFGPWTTFGYEMKRLLKTTIKPWFDADPENRAVVWRSAFAQHFHSVGGEWTNRVAEGCKSTDIVFDQTSMMITPNVRNDIIHTIATDLDLELRFNSLAWEASRYKQFAHPHFESEGCDGTHYCSNPLLWKPMYDGLYRAVETKYV